MLKDHTYRLAFNLFKDNGYNDPEENKLGLTWFCYNVWGNIFQWQKNSTKIDTN